MSLVGLDIRVDEKIKQRLDALPEDIADACNDAAMEYMLNVERQYPPYTYVSRAEAYPHAPAGPGWFSDKQRKAVMAKIRKGEITPGVPRRTQRFSRGWKIVGQGEDAITLNQSILVNEVPYGPYLKDNFEQSMTAFLGGWTIIQEDLQNHAPRIMRIIESTAKKILRKGKK